MPPREQHFRFNSRHQPPAWVQDQVFYQIFPDRFCNGDPSLSVKHHEYEYRGKAVISKAWGEPVSRHEEGHGACEFYGGDLAGIDAKLHYLQSPGVTALTSTPSSIRRATTNTTPRTTSRWMPTSAPTPSSPS